MSQPKHSHILQAELDRRDRQLFEMRLALLESRLEVLEDHETRMRLLEQRSIETRTVISIAFGTGVLSLLNLLSLWAD
jgi:hypothetical protein